MKRWGKWLLPTIMAACGAAAMLAGFVYDLAFAGIPYQDPPPELAAGYAFHSQVASTIRWGGLLMTAAGLIGLLVVAAWSVLKDRKQYFR